jgi:hypothetical protein
MTLEFKIPDNQLERLRTWIAEQDKLVEEKRKKWPNDPHLSYHKTHGYKFSFTPATGGMFIRVMNIITYDSISLGWGGEE